MGFRTGLFLVFGSVLGGFIFSGGSLGAILKPGEWIIIVGMGLGSFMIANPTHIQKSIFKNLGKLKKGTPHSKSDYINLLTFLFVFFKHANSSSLMETEGHVENPEASSIFTRFPIILQTKAALTFFCDYFRMITLGFDDISVLDNMMESTLSEKRSNNYTISHAVQKLGDSLPGIGIVAAVLGVVVAMRSAGADAMILGARVASALIGTFAGVFLSYGLVMPIGLFLDKFGESEINFIECIKVALVSYISGYPPSIAVEFARQVIIEDMKPSFYELEESISNLTQNI